MRLVRVLIWPRPLLAQLAGLSFFIFSNTTPLYVGRVRISRSICGYFSLDFLGRVRIMVVWLTRSHRLNSGSISLS